MSHRILATALLLLGFSAGSGLAADVHGDATAGSAKAAVCVACHGLNGNSTNPEWPVIAGQNAAYVSDQVRRIKTGMRPNPLMQPIVQDLSDQDIADVAAFFAVQTPTGNEADPSYWKAGERLYRDGDGTRGIPACMSCHGPVGRGVPAAGYPALQAQHAVYTMKQLDSYASGTRYNKDAQGKSQASPNAPIMATIAARLSAEDRRNLASYIQGLR
ncbi:MAG TPA: c-type cytochrome [Steroidobacteraceae bacterium]|nr:c-type cytochrome [Steroidobacteraceae bacterium]